MGIAILLAVYYVALAISYWGWIHGFLPAEPLAVLLAAMLIVVAIGCLGMMATLTAWFTRRGNRRLLALAMLVDAPPVLFLLYAGLRHYLAPAPN